MNSILQKACEELAKETPNIAYVRGMLETLSEIHGANLISSNGIQPTQGPTGTIYTPPAPMSPQDEAMILDAKAAAMMSSMPPVEMQ